MQNQRVTGKEQYYTPLSTCSYCVEKLLELGADKSACWLEPAGGTGNFIESMYSAGISQVISYDIQPKHRDVIKTLDFLRENLSHFPSPVITLTNPPFGRANSLSVPFFNKVATISSMIGFIVPKSWRKWSVINRLDQRFHLIYDEELRVDYECFDDRQRSAGKLATVFQVYEKREQPRGLIKIQNRGYIKKVDPKVADVALTIFGRGCGKVSTEFPRSYNTTKMFLKVKNNDVLAALKAVDYSRFYNNVAFIEALSIQEINYLLNEYFDLLH